MFRRPASRATVLGVAFGGVLLGHELTYALLQPRAGQRQILLATTGHAYLGVANHAALIVAVISLAAVFLGRLGGRAEDPSFRELTGRLAGFQFLTFAAIEVIERLSVSAPLHDLTHVLPVGALVQVAVAAATALLLRSLLRAADAVVATLGSPPPASVPATISLVVAADVAHGIAPLHRQRGRAPPR